MKKSIYIIILLEVALIISFLYVTIPEYVQNKKEKDFLKVATESTAFITEIEIESKTKNEIERLTFYAIGDYLYNDQYYEDVTFGMVNNEAVVGDTLRVFIDPKDPNIFLCVDNKILTTNNASKRYVIGVMFLVVASILLSELSFKTVEKTTTEVEKETDETNDDVVVDE